MDESVEQDEEVFVETMKEPEVEKEEAKSDKPEESSPKEDEPESVPITPSIKNIDDEPVMTKLTFNDTDTALDVNNNEEVIDAPKTIERLEDISMSRAIERKLAEDDEEDERITISSDNFDLSGFDVLDTGSNVGVLDDSEIKLDIEEL
jgi:hypothetical protein